MRGRMNAAFAAGLLLLCSAASLPARAAARGEDAVWSEVEEADMDTRALNDRGRKALALPGIGWKHAQTEHFVLHYEQAIFARKVARMADFFYSYIAEDLQGAQDRVDGRSHIFIFRNPKRWDEMRKAFEDTPEWTFSLVQGTTMLLQQADDTTRSGDILAHEMTHLVVNRFFTGRLPIWLSEGLAEYFEEFAYSAMKGIKKSKRAQFQRLRFEYPLAELFRATLKTTGAAGSRPRSRRHCSRVFLAGTAAQCSSTPGPAHRAFTPILGQTSFAAHSVFDKTTRA